MRVKIVLGAFLLFLTLAAARSQTSPVGYMQVSQNLNTPSSGPVLISIGIFIYPGNFSLRIYNSVGEVIRTLEDTNLTGVWTKTYSWDGTNAHGARVASGIYIIRGQDSSEVFNSRIAVHH
jgi:flagellar hook assembly protein FlgD